MSIRKNSLYLTFFYSVTGVAFFMAVAIGYFWIKSEVRGFDEDSQLLRNSYVAEQKNKVKNVVGQVIQHIIFRRDTAEQGIKDSLKGRVYEAVKTCQHLYEEYHDTKNEEEIKALIRESLRTIRFNHGRGYYFIYDMQGNNILLPNNPELEGKNLLDLKDDNGQYTVQRYIKIIREQGEGFMEWHWYRPGETTKMSKKIGFAKSFGALDWFIGTGEYVEDAEQEIRKEILAYINTIRFDNDNYVFVYDFEAITLAHFKPENLGKNQWNFVDTKGVPVLQELIRISQEPNGGFLQYVGTIKPETGKPSEKISYADSILDWRWMIGAGVYLDDIELVLVLKHEKLQQKIKDNTTKALLILLLTLIGIVFLNRYIFSTLKRNVKAFTSFFETAAQKAVRMDENLLHFDEFKQLIGPANSMLDARNKALEALQESEERLNLAIDATNQSLWNLNLENNTLIWDQRAFSIFDCDPTVISPSRKTIATRANPEDWAMAERAMEDHLAGHTETYRAEYRLQGKDAGWLWILEQGKITKRDEKGKAIRVVGTYIDITPAKEAENEKYELREQLNRSKKMEALGLLAGGVAHDLNNVLSGIVSYPDLLLESLPADSSLRKPLTTIRDSGTKAAVIVQDLLVLARRGIVIYDVVNLNQIITDYLASPEHKLLQSQYPLTRLKLRLDTSLLNLKGSAIHLCKALTNLITNAFEAQPEGGPIRIVTANRYLEKTIRGYESILPGEYVLLSVEDSGMGIAQEETKRIFEPFYTKKIMGHHSGTGLGMAIVWGTIQDHRGYIDVQSTEGKGTVFDLYFPITREESIEVQTEVPTQHLIGAGQHLLVIDDIPEQRHIAETILINLGYKVTTAESGEAALSLLRNQVVDLVVLDMIMDPGMDGLDTYRKIIEKYPGQKAIITSGYTETNRVKETQRLGAGQYLRKPFTFKGLGLAVHIELKRK
ncbi:MAG: response regulator [Desulfobulbaceae bacterium]|nr:response regulator [Desulfobulbaceae bacterium]